MLHFQSYSSIKGYKSWHWTGDCISPAYTQRGILSQHSVPHTQSRRLRSFISLPNLHLSYLQNTSSTNLLMDGIVDRTAVGNSVSNRTYTVRSGVATVTLQLKYCSVTSQDYVKTNSVVVLTRSTALLLSNIIMLTNKYKKQEDHLIITSVGVELLTLTGSNLVQIRRSTSYSITLQPQNKI